LRGFLLRFSRFSFILGDLVQSCVILAKLAGWWKVRRGKHV